jgi:cell division protease FtsH
MTEHAKSDPSTDRRRPAAPPPPPAWRNWLLVVGLVVSVLILFWPQREPSVSELSYTEFLSRVKSGEIATAVIDPGGGVSGAFENGGDYATQIPIALQDPDLAKELQASGVEITGQGEPGASVLSVILSFLPFLLLIGVYLYIGRRAQRQLAGGIGGIIGSRAKVYDAEAPSTRFSDVAGYEGAKQEISEVVDFLKNPQRYAKAGAMGPRGVLMVGPPGTGKTLLARAVAGEAGVPFVAITGSGFVELFVGVGASRVRELFNVAM